MKLIQRSSGEKRWHSRFLAGSDATTRTSRMVTAVVGITQVPMGWRGERRHAARIRDPSDDQLSDWFAMRNRRTSGRWLAALVAGSIMLSATALGAGRARAGAQTKPATQKVYREWTMADLLPGVADLGTGHDWAAGRELFKKVGCGICHAFGAESEGTGLAPDLTGVGSAYTREFILQSILEPSATINGRFFQTTFTLKNGTTVTGSVIDAGGGKILVAPVMMNPQATVEIAQADVKSEEPSTLSAMPAGLLNELTKEQIVELLAFLDAGGDKSAPVYRKK